jgi:hypothetical protein
VTYQPSTSDAKGGPTMTAAACNAWLDSPESVPDEPDSREQAQLLDLAHAEWERDRDAAYAAQFLDPAWDAECERRAVYDEGEVA